MRPGVLGGQVVRGRGGTEAGCGAAGTLDM